MQVYELLSKVSDYPRDNYKDVVNSTLKEVETFYPEASKFLSEFEKSTQNIDIHELEEIYTKTFDIKGLCCLDVGYVLFGEDYKRGDFLVNIQRMQREHNVDTGVELPDHMTNLLKLMPVLDEETRKELTEKIIMPALEKMMDNFNIGNSTQNYYSNILRTIDSVLKTDFKVDRTVLGGPVC